ncbi:cephalosporin hydroxylase family protein [Montanilutibacter psychrotolerans]|uniref:Cephalosporin hydroxylase n=1 Tax=Montanilutibacter psychrotolerans TaxID=1327343 RepID=A0A3M8SU85_9GAMM|nr:cephalosporin hydroxylase family protein [Lysobacter psychrotolerans]RNF84265.1 cephalosporin hydroxylase [Lysobacter psychrotolerans]
MSDFQEETRQRLRDVRGNQRLLADARAFTESSVEAKYSYNFTWQGRPIIQYPQDIVAMQELVWATRPDLIIETGIAHGGSLVLSASLLAMLDYTDALASGETLDPRAPRRRVLGVDIDIRAHNREAILAHPMAGRIDMLQGSSVAPDIVAQVAQAAQRHERVMVCLDSNHSHEHVLAELEAYAPLVTRGCYCVVFDTVVEDLPASQYPDRNWGPGDNPRTAVREYLRRLGDEGRTAADGAALDLEVDTDLESKLLVTVAPGGYLRRA